MTEVSQKERCKLLVCAANHFSHQQTTAEVLRAVTDQQRKSRQGNLHEPSSIFPIFLSSTQLLRSVPLYAKTSQMPRTFPKQWTHQKRLLLKGRSQKVSQWKSETTACWSGDLTELWIDRHWEKRTEEKVCHVLKRQLRISFSSLFITVITTS